MDLSSRCHTAAPLMQQCYRKKFCTSSMSLQTKGISTLLQHTLSKHHTILTNIWGCYKKINKGSVSLPPFFPKLQVLSIRQNKQGSTTNTLSELTAARQGNNCFLWHTQHTWVPKIQILTSAAAFWTKSWERPICSHGWAENETRSTSVSAAFRMVVHGVSQKKKKLQK